MKDAGSRLFVIVFTQVEKFSFPRFFYFYFLFLLDDCGKEESGQVEFFEECEVQSS